MIALTFDDLYVLEQRDNFSRPIYEYDVNFYIFHTVCKSNVGQVPSIIMDSYRGINWCSQSKVTFIHNHLEEYLSDHNHIAFVSVVIGLRPHIFSKLSESCNTFLNLWIWNDMESAVDFDLLLYADDSALLIRGKNIIDIEQKLSEELN